MKVKKSLHFIKFIKVINTTEVTVLDKDLRTPKLKNDHSAIVSLSNNSKPHNQKASRSTRSTNAASAHRKPHTVTHPRSESRGKTRGHHHTNTKQSKRQHKKTHNKLKSKYKLVKKTQLQLNLIVKKRYKTRICFIIIAICHSLYLLMNFIIMSQASIAAMALQSLSQLNLACKVSFMLFPPTTAYTLIHQLAIWLLVYAIRQHGIKLRTTPTHTIDDDADYYEGTRYIIRNKYIFMA